MSMKLAIGIGAACGLYAAAAWIVRDEPRRDVVSLGRDLARPAILPKLWLDVTRATERGDLATAVGASRDLMRYLPDWTDGYVLFAGMLAFDLGLREADASARLDALSAALQWLDEAKSHLSAWDRATLAASQATFVEARCDHDRELADLLEARTGLAPAELAMGYLDAALTDRPSSDALQERRAILLTRVVAAAIRAGDPERAKTLLDAAISMLRRVRDPEASIPWTAAMERIRPALDRETLDLEPLRGDPYLAEIIQALESR